MVRAMALGFALALLFPASAFPIQDAQAPSPAEVTHQVRTGETLAGIAREHYGDAGAWHRIFEANRERIADPDRISPGLRLIIPDAAAGDGSRRGVEARVVLTGVRLSEPGAGSDTLDHRARRALLERRPFQPSGEIAPPRQRTIFYEDRMAEQELLTQVLVRPQSEVPAFPAGVFHAAGWTVLPDAPLGSVGEVVSFDGGRDMRVARTSIHPFDEVRVAMDPAAAPVRVGDELLLARVNREVEMVGRILAPTGILQVLRVEGAGIVGRLVRDFGKSEIGDWIFPTRTFPLSPGVYPGEPRQHLEATILAFQDRKELHQPGDFLFIDRGQDHGVALGDQFSAHGGLQDGWQGRKMATLQVVGVQEERATLRILNTESPGALRPGLGLVLDRQMP